MLSMEQREEMHAAIGTKLKPDLIKRKIQLEEQLAVKASLPPPVLPGQATRKVLTDLPP